MKSNNLSQITDILATMPEYQKLIKQLNEKNTYLTAKLGIAEAIKGGYTTINDIWHYPWAIAQAAKEVGIRAVLSNKLKDTDLSKFIL